MKLLTKNKKIAASADNLHIVYNFGIPAYKSRTGLLTCPAAGTCGKDGGCYAQQGAYTWSNVFPAYEARLLATLADDFVERTVDDLTRLERNASRQGKTLVIRIHDSGDFYSLDYWHKWQAIMIAMPSVKFYAYTKMVYMFTRKVDALPSNFTLIFSEGGTQDALIKPDQHRHSRVFASLEELLAAGYADATKNDLVAAFGDNPKIGLVYHGAKSKAWKTA